MKRKIIIRRPKPKLLPSEGLPVVMCIDPGLAGTGIALFDAKEFEAEGCAFPCMPTTVVTYKKDEQYFKVFNSLFGRYNVQKVLCEGQQYMPSGKGAICAKTGGLVKLCNFAGALQGLAFNNDVPFEYIYPKDWKGTLDKDVVKLRIKKIWEKPTCKSHDWDAVGIGLWYQGYLNKNKNKK